MLIQEKLTSLSTAQTSLSFHKMRAGSSSVVHQSLTPDASAIVKQAASLAHRRGHAQVTPFHVAVTILSIPNGPFRSACLQSHSQSHPLRCRALDLCFNVALNRLPSSSQTLVGSYRSHRPSPSLSNALVAALKRAQAHQRRGSEQQPMIAVRIDVEQLIMSILDDPSVSRVMKEAGFSSARVKSFVEKAYPSPNPNTAEPMHGVNLRSEDVIAAISLELSLNHDSKAYTQLRSNGSNEDHEIRKELAFSLDISPNAPSIKHNASALPPWLVQHKEESRRATTSDVVSLHVNDQNSTLISGSSSHNPNSSSSTEIIETDYLAKFKELNAENLKALCNSLEKVTCQKEIIPNIASTILQCRSGMMKRRERSGSSDFIKEETWFLFLGPDANNKDKIARELATVIFGSHTNYISIRLGEFSSFSGRGSKRARLEVSKGYLESLVLEIQENPHRVFVLEEVEKVDYSSQMGILNAITSGTVRGSSGKDVSVRDAIIILSSVSFDIKSITCCRPAKQIFNRGEEEGAAFNLNFHFGCRAVGGSSDDFGFREAVDRVIVFKCPDDL